MPLAQLALYESVAHAPLVESHQDSLDCSGSCPRWLNGCKAYEARYHCQIKSSFMHETHSRQEVSRIDRSLEEGLNDAHFVQIPPRGLELTPQAR
jgi:hypothetical protein